MAVAVAWIEGGWVTIVTGEGLLRTHAKCLAALSLLLESGVVTDYCSQNGNGAIFVRLSPCKQN